MTTSKKISLTAVMAILAAAGYGGYTLIKEKDLVVLTGSNLKKFISVVK